MQIILDKYSEMNNRLSNVRDGKSFGELLYGGTTLISYYTELQKKTLYSIERIIPAQNKAGAHDYLNNYARKIDDFGKMMAEQFTETVKEKAKAESITIVKYKKQEGPWEREAATIKPVRNYIGIYSLQGIPVEEWVEVKGDPHWWGAASLASASLWWCDGKRNLNEIKMLCDLEAGRPLRNFDLVKYYRFLEKFDLVEFVK